MASTHPFGGAPAWTEIFMRLVIGKRDEGYVPNGYGFHDAEGCPWDDLAGLKVGNKVVNISLPREPWWIRAVHWASALEIMSTVWEAMDAATADGEMGGV